MFCYNKTTHLEELMMVGSIGPNLRLRIPNKPEYSNFP
jgi:hypothetical protein